MEEWRKMIYPKISSEHNHYEVSNEGRIKNTLTGHVLRQETLRTGYNSVRVNCDGKRKHIIIHKAIAYTFFWIRQKLVIKCALIIKITYELITLLIT